MTIRAVLFDVGGPIDTEVLRERLIDADIRAALAQEGIATDDSAYAAANARAVASFAPDAYSAIIWDLASHRADVSRRVSARVAAREQARRGEADGIEIRDGIADVIGRLSIAGLRLGLAANQHASVIADLDRAGIGRFFAHREVSGHHGFRKPDPRLFLRACEDLGVSPAECIMVGDRIDNDIAPAKWLGMRAVLIRTGRHAAQQPRSWHEVPDAEVFDSNSLEAAVVRLVADAR